MYLGEVVKKKVYLTSGWVTNWSLHIVINQQPFFYLTAVFASVGGLYFFLRTTLNAFIKCARVVVFIIYKYIKRLTTKFNTSAEDEELPLVQTDEKPDKARVSLLASLPRDYQGFSTTVQKQTLVNPCKL